MSSSVNAEDKTRGRCLCEPCKAGDKKVNAIKLCPVCPEYLCEHCAFVHDHAKSTRTHQLSTINDNTRNSPLWHTQLVEGKSAGVFNSSDECSDSYCDTHVYRKGAVQKQYMHIPIFSSNDKSLIPPRLRRCQPCLKVAKFVNANGICELCKDKLCRKCKVNHKCSAVAADQLNLNFERARISHEQGTCRRHNTCPDKNVWRIESSRSTMHPDAKMHPDRPQSSASMSEEEEENEEQNAGNGNASFDEVETQFMEALANGGLPELLRKADEYVDVWKKVTFNIGVTGDSGAGKSSFINAFRGLTAEDEGAAPVGVVECTTEATPYTHPENKSVILWDLPGIGTPRWPHENYLDRIEYGKFDFFFILCSCRFSEDDLFLLEQLGKKRKQSYLIRTKIDQDVNNEKRSYPKHTLHDIMQKIRNDCEKNVSNTYGRDTRVYLINSFNTNEYDFRDLSDKLLADTNALKKEAMAFTLHASTEDILRSKHLLLGRRVEQIAKCYTWRRWVPLPMNYFECLQKEVKLYLEQFNIDKNSQREIDQLLKEHGLTCPKTDSANDQYKVRKLLGKLKGRFLFWKMYNECKGKLSEILDKLFKQAIEYTKKVTTSFTDIIAKS